MAHTEHLRTLGIDIGGVITDRCNDGTEVSLFKPNYLGTVATPGAFKAIRTLVHWFEGRVYLVAKFNPEVQVRAMHWLGHHRFYERTGFRRGNERFCLERREKAGICAELGISHFVDDRLEVLASLATVRHRYLFMPRRHEMLRYIQHLPRVDRVEDWNYLLARIIN